MCPHDDDTRRAVTDRAREALQIGAFRGKSRVQQHQMVYQALRGRMGNELHALALQTGAPED